MSNTGIIRRFKVYRKGIGMVVVNLQWQRLMGGSESPCRLCENYHQCASEETACEQFPREAGCPMADPAPEGVSLSPQPK